MQQQEGKSNSTKKRIQILSITIIALALLSYAGTTIHHAMTYESTDNAQIESNAIPVLSRVSGYINVFELKDYQSVKAGQLLITIDDREYKLAVQQALADLAVAKADLTNAQEQLNNLGSDKNVASAGVGVEQVNREKAALDLKRDQALYNEGSITEHQLDNSKAASQVALKQLASSKTRVLQVSTQSGMQMHKYSGP
ncbi:HlyD family secretion protein [Arcticibacter eurypsychrophilus]|uniref:HlyD family secretion protein n=1 Tax=Arcticibacter eurypsychrophilus TaxID=1434752 RepID=UPI00084E0A80|nr:biotin/lipoyl-binding protein [Arcticibacter eurypsychrophilus]